MLNPPNILLLMADQFRADGLGCVNGYVKTPNLDALARRGVLFTNVFANSVECVPSRFSLAVGLYPHQHRVWTNAQATLNPRAPNWMRAVRDQGYRTALVGKTHLHPHVGDLRDRLDLMHGYGLQIVDETAGPRASASVLSHMTESWREAGVWSAYQDDLAQRFSFKPHVARPSTLPLEHYYDVYVGQRGRSFLEVLSDAEPWFCWISFGGPHEPWDAPEPYASMYRPADMPKPIPRIQLGDGDRSLFIRTAKSKSQSPSLSDREVAEMRANYAGNITLIDDQIGDILGSLERRNQTDRTVIIFTSDHGEMNGDHGLIYKSTFLDPALKVPLIIKSPGPSSPRCERAIVELMDVGQTICDYAGYENQIGHAQSVRPLLEGKARYHRACAVSEFGHYAAIVSPRWKAEIDPSGEITMLLDRANDPNEQRNLVRDVEPHVAELMKRRWMQFRSDTPEPEVPPALMEIAH